MFEDWLVAPSNVVAWAAQLFAKVGFVPFVAAVFIIVIVFRPRISRALPMHYRRAVLQMQWAYHLALAFAIIALMSAPPMLISLHAAGIVSNVGFSAMNTMLVLVVAVSFLLPFLVVTHIWFPRPLEWKRDKSWRISATLRLRTWVFTIAAWLVTEVALLLGAFFFVSGSASIPPMEILVTTAYYTVGGGIFVVMSIYIQHRISTRSPIPNVPLAIDMSRRRTDMNNVQQLSTIFLGAGVSRVLQFLAQLLYENGPFFFSAVALVLSWVISLGTLVVALLPSWWLMRKLDPAEHLMLMLEKNALSSNRDSSLYSVENFRNILEYDPDEVISGSQRNEQKSFLVSVLSSSSKEALTAPGTGSAPEEVVEAYIYWAKVAQRAGHPLDSEELEGLREIRQAVRELIEHKAMLNAGVASSLMPPPEDIEIPEGMPETVPALRDTDDADEAAEPVNPELMQLLGQSEATNAVGLDSQTVEEWKHYDEEKQALELQEKMLERYGSYEIEGYGADPYGYGVDPYGYGADPYGYGGDPYGYGADPYGYGTDAYGYGGDPYGYGADPYGYGMGYGPYAMPGNPYTPGANPYGGYGYDPYAAPGYPGSAYAGFYNGYQGANPYGYAGLNPTPMGYLEPGTTPATESEDIEEPIEVIVEDSEDNTVPDAVPATEEVVGAVETPPGADSVAEADGIAAPPSGYDATESAPPGYDSYSAAAGGTSSDPNWGYADPAPVQGGYQAYGDGAWNMPGYPQDVPLADNPEASPMPQANSTYVSPAAYEAMPPEGVAPFQGESAAAMPVAPPASPTAPYASNAASPAPVPNAWAPPAPRPQTLTTMGYSRVGVSAPIPHLSAAVQHASQNQTAPRPAAAAQPVQPTQPAQPAQASKPAQPTQPAQPVRPAQTAQPAQPAQASKPAQPAKPAQQVQPAQAAKPAQPAQPVRPVQQVQPAQEVKPAQPAQPAQASKPAQPTKPVQPVKPAQFAQPSQPVPPAKLPQKSEPTQPRPARTQPPEPTPLAAQPKPPAPSPQAPNIRKLTPPAVSNSPLGAAGASKSGNMTRLAPFLMTPTQQGDDDSDEEILPDL